MIGQPDRPLAGSDREAWLGLALVPGIGPARLAELIRACGSAAAALGAPLGRLEAIPGIPPEAARAVASASTSRAGRARAQVEAMGGVVLLPGDADFPARLLELDEWPTHLFALGRPELLRRPAVAIVGSRDHSPYGAEVAAALGSGAAQAGLAVVSGMARGLDAVAHRAALRVDGATIAVLGNGLGVTYPQCNRSLYRDLADRGLLVTELLPGEAPTPGSFPRRNRLIAGLTRAVVVVEAAVGSGALITAGHALEQGREVLAVPGQITNPRSRGANQLIRDGARPLLGLEDLLQLFPEAARPLGEAVPPPPTTPRGQVLVALAEGPVHVDAIAQRLGWRAAETLGLLGALEIEGLVAQRPGMLFARALSLVPHA